MLLWLPVSLELELAVSNPSCASVADVSLWALQLPFDITQSAGMFRKTNGCRELTEWYGLFPESRMHCPKGMPPL